MLTGVHALSARDVWAAGLTGLTSSGGVQALIEHWNGRLWRRITSPGQLPANPIGGLGAVSASQVWAAP